MSWTQLSDVICHSVAIVVSVVVRWTFPPFASSVAMARAYSVRQASVAMVPTIVWVRPKPSPICNFARLMPVRSPTPGIVYRCNQSIPVDAVQTTASRIRATEAFYSALSVNCRWCAKYTAKSNQNEKKSVHVNSLPSDDRPTSCNSNTYFHFIALIHKN